MIQKRLIGLPSFILNTPKPIAIIGCNLSVGSNFTNGLYVSISYDITRILDNRLFSFIPVIEKSFTKFLISLNSAIFLVMKLLNLGDISDLSNIFSKSFICNSDISTSSENFSFKLQSLKYLVSKAIAPTHGISYLTDI